MSSSLSTERVASVLKRLFATAEASDPQVMAMARDEAERRGNELHESPDKADLLANAYLAVPPECGLFLYVLGRSQRSKLIVEFGTSFGISTIYLACAVRDNGRGRVVTTELSHEKVLAATENLREAGLLDLVEIREGDALETLRNLDGQVDLLFLDGWNQLYLSVLQVVESRLPPSSLVVADDLDLFPEDTRPYLDYVRRQNSGYISVEIPLGDRFDLAVRHPITVLLHECNPLSRNRLTLLSENGGCCLHCGKSTEQYGCEDRITNYCVVEEGDRRDVAGAKPFQRVRIPKHPASEVGDDENCTAPATATRAIGTTRQRDRSQRPSNTFKAKQP